MDVGIARLIAACWDLAIPTTYSCQGSADEHAYVTSPPGFAEAFARAATSTDRGARGEPEDPLDLRIYEFRDFADPLGWRWSPGYRWRPGFTVYFPAADIAELLRRLESYR